MVELTSIHDYWKTIALTIWTFVGKVMSHFLICCLTISFSATPFSFCFQSFPASGSFPRTQLFASGGQSIGASASASVLPMNIQDWFPLELTGLISLLSMGLSRVFSNTTLQKHQFFSAEPSLWSNSHIHTWLLEKPKLWLYGSLCFPGILLLFIWSNICWQFDLWFHCLF